MINNFQNYKIIFVYKTMHLNGIKFNKNYRKTVMHFIFDVLALRSSLIIYQVQKGLTTYYVTRIAFFIAKEQRNKQSVQFLCVEVVVHKKG